MISLYLICTLSFHFFIYAAQDKLIIPSSILEYFKSINYVEIVHCYLLTDHADPD